ncbi:MAG: type IV pilus biogenesis protein PilM [Blastopirellula sp. JB062]
MAKLIGIEWDGNEIRVVVARPRSGGVTIESAFAAPRTDDLAASIRTALTDRNIAAGPVSVTLPRSAVELHVLTLPPAPPEELPDMVRFAAIREFTALTDDWLLDYAPIETNAVGQATILAAGISGKGLKTVETPCASASLAVEHVGVRPLAAASLMARDPHHASSVALVVESSSDDIELTVIDEGAVVFTRSTRLPGEVGSEDRLKALQLEARRTLIAARNQLGAHSVEKIVLVGDEELSAMQTSLASALGLPAELYDPFSSPAVKYSGAEKLNNRGRYAGLLGLLADQAAPSSRSLDLRNPRRRPPPPSKRRQYVTYSSVAAIAAALVIGWIWLRFASIDGEIEAAQRKLSSLKESNQAAVLQQNDVEKIDRWLDTNIQWLDQTYWLASNLPPAEETILTRLNMDALQSEGGVITIDGYVADEGGIKKLESSLRDERHLVSNLGSKQADVSGYHWNFQERILVAKPTEERFTEETASNEETGSPTESSPAADDDSGQQSTEESGS